MGAFKQQRIWERARRLAISQLVCLGRHTMTGLLYTCGRQFVDWSADYRVFSQDKWEPKELFMPVVQGVLDLSPPTEPFVTAIDDTRLKKTGTKIPGASYGRDPLSPPFHTNLVRGQRFIQLSGMVPAGEEAGPARSIPLRFEHSPAVPKPKRSASAQEWKAYEKQRRANNLSTHAVDLLEDIRLELDHRHQAEDRPLVVAVDGSYTNQTVLKGLPDRTILIGRIRKDAKLFHPPSQENQPSVGAKRKYGDEAPTPEQLRKDTEVPWEEVTAFGAGKMHTFRVKTLAPLLWKKAGPDIPLRMVVIAPVGYRPRKGSKVLYRQPAYLICTDADLPLDKLIQYYLWRWDIEVNHRDEKQIIGVGQAQVRAEQSVERQPQRAVASYAMLLLAGVQALGVEGTEGSLPVPKWQAGHPKQRVSTPKLIEQLRSEVWPYALDQLDANSNSSDFVASSVEDTKSVELSLPLPSAALYANAG